MIQIKLIENQTVFDIAKQYYGTIEAVGEILENNPHLINNKLYTYHLEDAIDPTIILNIDEKSALRDENVLKNINKNIILWQEPSKI